MLGPGIDLTARELGFSPLFEEPGDDPFAVVSLDFDNAILGRTPCPAVTFQRFRDVVGFAIGKPMDDADDARAPSFAGYADDAVGGHWRLGHEISFGMERLCIFSGANQGHHERYRTTAAGAARAIVAAGYGIVYGGGRIGLMGAVADAALEAGGEVIGVIPHALANAEVAHSGTTMLHVVDSMHERKAMMVDLSDGFIALPGGFGTMDEFHEVLTWRQLHIHDKPIGLLNTFGFYDALLAQFDLMEREGFMSARSRGLFVTDATIDGLLGKMFG